MEPDIFHQAQRHSEKLVMTHVKLKFVMTKQMNK
jgi:hypothetical protein